MKKNNRLLITDYLPRLTRVKAGRLPSPGFTLTEVLLAAIISSFFLIIVANIFTRIIQDTQRIITLTNLQKTSDQILLNITQEGRWAKEINTVSFPSNEITFKNTILSQDQLITYQQTGNNLIKITDVNPGTSNDITENLNPSSIKVNTFTVINRSVYLTAPSFEIRLDISDKPRKY